MKRIITAVTLIAGSILAVAGPAAATLAGGSWS